MAAAIVYVTEFSELAPTAAGQSATAAQPPMAEQTITSSASSAQCANAFQPATRFVRMHCDTSGPVCIEFGANPTATVTTARMAANQTEYFAVPRGQGWKVAVIAATA